MNVAKSYFFIYSVIINDYIILALLLFFFFSFIYLMSQSAKILHPGFAWADKAEQKYLYLSVADLEELLVKLHTEMEAPKEKKKQSKVYKQEGRINQ